MDFSLTDKTALVTGSYRGTGFAIAKTLIAEGAKVLVHGITPEQAAAAVAELNGGIPVAGDISDPAGCQNLLEACAGQWAAKSICKARSANYATFIVAGTDDM